MSETIEKLLQKGSEFHQLGQAKFASQIYKVILLAEPNHPEASYNMGLLAVSAGQIEAGLTFLETALEANADNAMYWVTYIDVLLEIGRIEDAQAVFDQAKFNGAKGEGFDKLEQRLTDGRKEPLTANSTGLEEKHPKQPNILDSLKLDQALSLARKKARGGDTGEAKRIYQDILAKFPKNKRARDGLKGLSSGPVGKESKVQDPPHEQLQALINLYSQGQLQQALHEAETLVQKFPQSAILFNVQGAVFKDLGQLDQSIEAYNKALATKPDYAEAYNNMGNTFKEQGKLEEAIEAYNKAIIIKPDNTDAYNNMGNAMKEQGKLEEAIGAYNKALDIKPDNANAYYNMGRSLQELGKLEEAIEAYNKSLAIKPDNADAYYNMGNALNDQVKLEEAVEAYNKALAIKPNDADAYCNMGVTLQGQGKLEEAIEAYNGALDIKPDHANAYYNMGVTLQGQGKLEEAIEAYNRALDIKPDHAEAHMTLCFALLNANRLSEAFVEYEWRWKIKDRSKIQRHFSQPLWDGRKSLKGKKILLWCEQGVGDTIHWSYCLPFIASQAEHCILECQEKLVPLLARSFPNVEVKHQNRSLDAEKYDFDYHLPMGSLYRHCITKLPLDFKVDAYLVPDPVRVNFWRKRLHSIGKGPYVGISWKSGNMGSSRLPNYASISELLPILTLPDITFINLQYIDFEDDLAKIQKDLGVIVHNFDDLDHYDNLDEVAALSAALDVVVSVISAVPIITAGVGTCTKLASWRQSPFNNIINSPFGPSLDKFFRNTSEPWGNVFELIAKDINPLMKNRS